MCDIDTMSKAKIITLRKTHIDDLVQLMAEFDVYLGKLSSASKVPFDATKKRMKILKDGFWRNRQYLGYLAKLWTQSVGYILYHYGYDPDEMEGKVIYIIDLFVSEKARGHGIGRLLMNTLQEKDGIIALYFCVWKKNTSAVDFYKKLGAEWVDDVPYMKLPIRLENWHTR